MTPRTPLSSLLLLAAIGCHPGLTREEAAEALDESELSSQAAALTSSTVELTTDFTIGDAVERAAEEIRAFYASQLPCANVTLSGATLTVEYGENGLCAYRGQTYTGTHTVTVSRNEMSEVIVNHSWDALSNQRVEVSGSASVTWSFADPSRHVVHELEWTRLRDGRSAVGSGDRVQRPLPEGLDEGISEDGRRTWEGESGTWDLDIDGVEFHWRDPVPREGAFRLDTPFDKRVTLDFDGVDEDTIHVTVKSGKQKFEFNVSSLR